MKKVLIIDDDKEFLEELGVMLGLGGYETLNINDSSKALDAVQKFKPEVILMDMKMDGLSGYDLTLKLKQNKDTVRIPVIAMSGFYKDDVYNIKSAYGEDKYLKKPFTPLDVISKIEGVLK